MPIKAKFLGKDLERTAALYNIPLVMPKSQDGKSFQSPPFSTKNANHLICSIEDLEKRIKVTTILWNELYGRGNSTPFHENDIQPLFEILNQSIAIPGSAKQTYISNTEEATLKGAFGSPTMIITNPEGKEELFFGSDRFLHVAAFIGADASALINESLFRSKV